MYKRLFFPKYNMRITWEQCFISLFNCLLSHPQARAEPSLRRQLRCSLRNAPSLRKGFLPFMCLQTTALCTELWARAGTPSSLQHPETLIYLAGCQSTAATGSLPTCPVSPTCPTSQPLEARQPDTLPLPFPRGRSCSHKTIQLGWCPHLIRLLQMVGQKQ